MAANLETVIKQLSESSIISQGKLENFLPPRAHPKTAEELVAELVKQNQLTPFQAQHVKAGKAKALILGNYTILETIGAGGMGQVFKAEHRRMERIVALKMLPPAMNKNASALARFQREVKAAARLRHPNIVAADDADEANGSHFLVMEYVEGRDLSAYVKKLGPFSVDKAVNYTLQAARGLEFAHAEGVIHRDIKPGNLLLDKKGVVKILDMGLARIDVAQGDVAAQAELTGTGAVMGTVDYMAPEQGVNTHDVDARADIYSLGCTLHHLLIGKPVYEGQTVGAKFLAHHRKPIPNLIELRSEVPAEINAIFQKMVAKEPEDRYQTMTEVIADLQACEFGHDGSLTMHRTIGSSSDNSALKSIRKSRLASIRSRKKKTASSSADKKKLIYGGIGAGVLGILILLTIVVLLRDDGDTEVAEAVPPTAVVPVAKVEPAATVATPPTSPQSAAKVEPPATKAPPSATTIAPPASAPMPIAKTERPAKELARATPAKTEVPAATPTTSKPITATPPAKAPEKKPAPIVVARVEPPIAKPTAIDANPTTPPATKAPAPAPAANVEPEVKKDARLPTPSAAALMKAEQLVQDLFKAGLTQSKLPDQKVALAEKILAQVDITRDDPAAKYAMLRETVRLATDLADVRILQEAIDTLAGGYVVNPAEIWIESLEKAGQKQRPPAINKSLAQAALKQLDKLDVYDNSELAARLQVAALAPARKARDPALLKEVVELGKSLAAARKQIESIGKIKEVLEKNPLDAPANLTLGRYLAFVKGDWQQGFTHLAKGSDSLLAELAVRSLANVNEPSAQTALADAWWKESETAKGTDKSELQLAAGYWDAQALPQLSGLSRTVAEQRIRTLPPKKAQALLESATQAWIDLVAPLPAAQQLEAVLKKLQDLNSGYTGECRPRIDNGVVTELAIEGKFITDLSPVRALVGLRYLSCAGAKLTDLSALRGMNLETLRLDLSNALRDISALEGMKLVSLDLGRTQVDDLSPLRGMRLTTLNLYQAGRVADLSPIKGMKLTYLNVRNCPLISDLEPIRGMPLVHLLISAPQIRDFSPLQGMKPTRLELSGCVNFRNLELLQGMKLNQLILDGTGVTDLNPLRGMPLETIWLTPKNITAGMDLLRSMTSLRRIGVDSSHHWPAADFWPRYDQGEFR